MARIVKFSATVTVTLAAILMASPVFATPRQAPADEYFGRLRMSVLGITNVIHDSTWRHAHSRAGAVKDYGSLKWAEDALEDWARKYPDDPWIPSRASGLCRLLTATPNREARTSARRACALAVH
jgi:hypothetical protein